MKRFRWFAACLALVAGVALFVSTVSAHANLTKSEPAEGTIVAAAPGEVKLWFGERLERQFSSAYLVDSNGTRIPTSDSVVSTTDPYLMTLAMPTLTEGTYTVVWQALSSDDGHKTFGAIAFGIGDPTVARTITPAITASGASGATPLGILGRWINFIGGTLLVGAIVFQLAALRSFGIDEVATHRIRRILIAGLIGLVVGWPLLVLAQASSLSTTGSIFDMTAIGSVMQTRYGQIMLLRLAILVALGAAVFWATRSALAKQTVPSAAVGIAAAGVLLTSSLGSHAAGAGTYAWIAIGFDWVHYLSAAIWVGEIAAFLATLGSLQRQEAVGTVLPRFSVQAMISVVLLTITGIYSVWLHVPNSESLFETPYGQALVFKVALVGVMLVIGAVNLFWGLAAGRFRWRLIAETALGVGVLIGAAFLVNLPPAATVAGDIYRYTQPAGDLRLSLMVAPNQVGANRFTLNVTDAQGRPVDNIDRASLRLTMLDMEMGSQDIALSRSGSGEWVGQGSLISMVGNWGLRPIVTINGVGDVEARFSDRVGRTVIERGPFPVPADFGLSPYALVPILAIPIGLFLLLASFRIMQRNNNRGLAGLFSGLALVLVAIGMIIFTPMTEARIEEPNNTVPRTAQSIEAGRQRYQQNCAGCHGATGLGDGPQARDLAIPPADLWRHVAFHTDGGLYLFIANGVKGTPMPAWGNTFTPDEIWDIVNYMRTTFAAPTSGE